MTTGPQNIWFLLNSVSLRFACLSFSLPRKRGNRSSMLTTLSYCISKFHWLCTILQKENKFSEMGDTYCPWKQSLSLDLSVVNLSLSRKRMRCQKLSFFWIQHIVAKTLFCWALWNAVSMHAKSNSDCYTEEWPQSWGSCYSNIKHSGQNWFWDYQVAWALKQLPLRNIGKSLSLLLFFKWSNKPH